MSWADAYIKKLSKGETVQFRPRGHSMAPRINDRDLVTVAPARNYPEFRKGDIVLCKVKGSVYLHLVTAVRTNVNGRVYQRLDSDHLRESDESREMTCPLCERETDEKDMSDHHLVPKSRGGKQTETICHPCHRQIHALFDNHRLERELYTVEALQAEPSFAKYLKWAAKRPPGQRFKTKAARGKRKR